MHTVKTVIAAVKDRVVLRPTSGALGIGLIGIGGWGAVNAANIMRTRRFTVLGVHDIKTDVAKRFSDRFHVKHFASVEDVLSESTIQAVCITVPNNLHPDLVRAAADAGKHVFVEKPLASDPLRCRELGKHCTRRQVVLQVGHQMRRDPVFREIKRIVASGLLGAPLYVQGVYTLDRRTRDDWRRDSNVCPAASMEQLGVHLLDCLVYLFGHPLASCGWAQNIPMRSSSPDWGGVLLTFPNGVKALIGTSFFVPSHMSLEMFFANGRLATDGRAIRIVRRNGTMRSYKPTGERGDVLQFVEFADCIEHARQPETGAEEAAVVMEAVQSMFSGAPCTK